MFDLGIDVDVPWLCLLWNGIWCQLKWTVNYNEFEYRRNISEEVLVNTDVWFEKRPHFYRSKNEPAEIVNFTVDYNWHSIYNYRVRSTYIVFLHANYTERLIAILTNNNDVTAGIWDNLFVCDFTVYSNFLVSIAKFANLGQLNEWAVSVSHKVYNNIESYLDLSRLKPTTFKILILISLAHWFWFSAIAVYCYDFYGCIALHSTYLTLIFFELTSLLLTSWQFLFDSSIILVFIYRNQSW